MSLPYLHSQTQVENGVKHKLSFLSSGNKYVISSSGLVRLLKKRKEEKEKKKHLYFSLPAHFLQEKTTLTRNSDDMKFQVFRVYILYLK